MFTVAFWFGLAWQVHTPPAAAVDAGSRTRPDLEATDADSLYLAHHPRLLFDAGDIPTLYDKVRDGGYDDLAYSLIRVMVEYIYPGDTPAGILGDDFGLASVPMLGIATFLESPEDEDSRTMGRNAILYLVSQYGVDYNDYDSALRLRSLALGYDLFFANAPEAERSLVRTEIAEYVDTMITSASYKGHFYRPYLSNRSAMVAAAVGLGALCLDGETDSVRVSDALAFADELISAWTTVQVDRDGAYNEGVLYAGWSLRHLVYYFAARERYDGTTFSDGKIRKMENWFCYELLPEGNGKTNNLNDSGYGDDPLPQHHTYFDWAQSEWSSGLSAWLYEHIAGTYGWDWGPKADKTATVLWNRSLTPVQPISVLPSSRLWADRGLYYFRTGWPSGDSSTDVVFSFYSGSFHGGHAQEDQGQFTLYGYGAKFAVDHGPGTLAKESEAHNIVFVDGEGQHNAGSSIGTDGDITGYLLSGFADRITSDNTAAYCTYSAWNNPGYPFPGTDWSWGYDGGNPVEFARREVLVAREVDGRPPYFVIVDDIEKDGLPHTYQWRLHTLGTNTVDTTGGRVQIVAPTGYMDIHALNPPRSALGLSITSYNNMTNEPDSKLISFEAQAADPQFAFLLLPRSKSMPAPEITQEFHPWGETTTITWGTTTDFLLVNHSGTVADAVVAAGGMSPAAHGNVPASPAAGIHVRTDAPTLLARFDESVLSGYIVADVESLVVDDTTHVVVANGVLGVARSGTTIHIDRYDAEFTIYAPGVTEIRYHDQLIPFIETGGYLSPDPTGIATDHPLASGWRLSALAYPNPFNPSTTVAFELPEMARVSAVVYDVTGRVVRHLFDRTFAAGQHTVGWAGDDNAGRVVSSGVYFVRLVSTSLGGSSVATVKITVVK